MPGFAKTRLIPALGPEGAAQLHRRLTEHAVDVARAAGAGMGAGITVCFTGAARRDFRSWLGDDLTYTAQPSGDIGVRTRQAFLSAFRNGAQRVVAFGTDIPDLSAAILLQAFAALREHDVVLGPATDGGYYLIGMKRDRPELFTGVDWGTERVCAQTRAAIARQGLSVAEVPTLSDVDLPEDAAVLRADPRFADVWTSKPLLSVIVPTLNEAASLGRTLTCLRRAGSEIIVVDGGSQDATREIAGQAGATILVAAGGRAAQQNAAAAVAKGRRLLFLHADTLPPDGYAELIHRTLDHPATVAGAFHFRTDGSGAVMQLIEWGANVRSAVFQWPYGDQGLFMEKRVFDELGGFAPLPIMEDYELVSRLRRRGRVVTLNETAITSARRWQRLGALRTTARNLAMIAGFHAGIPPVRLARFYRGNRA